MFFRTTPNNDKPPNADAICSALIRSISSSNSSATAEISSLTVGGKAPDANRLQCSTRQESSTKRSTIAVFTGPARIFCGGLAPNSTANVPGQSKIISHEPPTATNRPIETFSPAAMIDRSSAFRGNGTEREKFNKNVAINIAESSNADTQNIRRADCFAKPSS